MAAPERGVVTVAMTRLRTTTLDAPEAAADPTIHSDW
jgi:hypothetical protein